VTTARAQAGGLALAAVVLAACGGDDRSTAPEHAFLERSGLDSAMVLDVICDGWELGFPDHLTINGYVHDLLSPLELVNSDTPPAYSQEDINIAVASGCDEHSADPPAFIDAVLDDLGLTGDDLDARVDRACARYRTEQARIARDDWSGEDIDGFIRDIATDRDTTLLELRDAVANICPE
jgi:hypothetical protein